MLRLGVDIGGTKTEVVVLDASGNERFRHRRPTPHSEYRDAVLDIISLIREAEIAVAESCSVGVGAPGSVSPQTGVLRNAYATPYNEQCLQRDLETLLQRSVRVANDANCFASSESVDGAARGARAVFGAILGTGVGGAVVIQGRVWEGANAMAGEWGHNPLPGAEQVPLPPCACGRRGCIQAFVSGPGMTFDHAALTGQEIAPDVIVERALQGDAKCEATLVRFEYRLARALAEVINVLDPDVIVLGGGLSSIDRLYDNVPRLWRPHVYLPSEETRLVRPLHGDSSGARGAAWLWNSDAP